MLPRTIILCGGRGTRLAGVTDLPKCMVEVRGRRIIDHQIEMLLDAGVDEIDFCLGYGAEIVRGYIDGRYPRLHRVYYEDDQKGTAGALWRPTRTGRECFVLNGDVIFAGFDVVDFYNHSYQTKACLAVTEVEDASDYGTVELAGSQVIGFNEKRPGRGAVSMGFYWFPLDGVHGYIPQEGSLERDVFPMFAGAGRLQAYLTTGTFIDCGTPQRLAAANGE